MGTKLVYRHINTDTLEVFYVGIGNKKRPKSKDSRNRLWNEYVKENPNYYVEIIAVDLSHEDACELEILLIEEYGRQNLNTGCLVNMTRGGEGVLDCQTMGDLNPAKRPEVREKLRIASTGKRNGMYGKKGKDSPIYGERNGMYGKKGKKNGMYGKKNGMHGRTGKTNPFYGKTHSKEFIRQQQVNQSNPVFMYNRNNELINSFECVTDCKEFYKCTSENIWYRIKTEKFGSFGKFKDLLITTKER